MLVAVGVQAHVTRDAKSWLVLVAEDDVDRAREELTAYQQEEQDAKRNRQSTPMAGGKGLFETVLAFVLTISTTSMIGWSAVNGPTFTAAGLSDAGLVRGGEVWRTVTALTLHADLPHLFSNLVFGTLFIVLAGRWLGGGVAALLTLVGGAIGNGINALIQDASHTSLGASTAVFSALGIAVAMALRPSIRTQTSMMRQWSPLIGGAVLLSMYGTGGERTDVTAHVTGFLSGLVAGWLASFAPHAWRFDVPVQSVAAVSAAVIIPGAWMLALLLGGVAG